MTKSCNNPIARRIIQAASAGGRIRLIVDVTPLYGDLKLFTVSIAYRRRAVPLVWKVIDKAGTTDAVTQIELLEHLIPLIPKGVEVVIIGDGEFRSTELVGWLYTKKWHYRLRVAKDTYIRDKYGEWVQLQALGLSKGETLFLQGIFLTKDDPTGPVNLAMTWNRGEDEPWYIVTDQTANWGTLTDYKVRMWIEEMHADLKGNGLHLDQTHLHDPFRISRLFLAVSILYVWLMHTGSWSDFAINYCQSLFMECIICVNLVHLFYFFKKSIIEKLCKMSHNPIIQLMEKSRYHLYFNGYHLYSGVS